MGNEAAAASKSKKSFFSRFFGGKKKDAAANAQNVGSNSENERQAYGRNFKERVRNFNKFEVSEANDLFEVGAKLGKSSKLGFKSNSDSFEIIGMTLTSVNRTISQPFSFEHKQYNDRTFDSLITTFELLINCCDRYIDEHTDPKSSYGKERKELVMKLKGIAQVDKVRLESNETDFKNMDADSQSKTSFFEMLKSARTVQLHTDDYEQLRDSKATGGLASDVMKLNVSGNNVRGLQEGEQATHYFKFEDSIDLSKGDWQETDEGRVLTGFNGSMVVDDLLKRFQNVAPLMRKLSENGQALIL